MMKFEIEVICLVYFLCHDFNTYLWWKKLSSIFLIFEVKWEPFFLELHELQNHIFSYFPADDIPLISQYLYRHRQWKALFRGEWAILVRSVLGRITLYDEIRYFSNMTVFNCTTLITYSKSDKHRTSDRNTHSCRVLLRAGWSSKWPCWSTHHEGVM